MKDLSAVVGSGLKLDVKATKWWVLRRACEEENGFDGAATRGAVGGGDGAGVFYWRADG